RARFHPAVTLHCHPHRAAAQRSLSREEVSMQPSSIRKFTLFYFAAFLVTLAATAMTFEGLLAAAEVQAGARLGFGVLIAGIAFWAAILLVLWYFIARNG